MPRTILLFNTLNKELCMRLFLVLSVMLSFTIEAFSKYDPLLFKVQSYNIKGLPPLAAPGWDNGRFTVIKEILLQKHESGTAPDVIVFQEVFTKEAQDVLNSGYPFMSQGPTRDGIGNDGPYQKVYSSGLYILSKHPIIESGLINFGQSSCATYDCHANKGVQYIKIQHPLYNKPITLFNTHMQSGRAHDTVRLNQAQMLVSFINEKYKQDGPLIVAGDFNNNINFPSFFIIKDGLNLNTSGDFCLNNQSICKINNSRPEDLYENTHDHIFYLNTHNSPLIPLVVERNFTETFKEKPLSDHLGYETTFLIQ